MIFGNMGEMMKMAREMQDKMKQLKDELADKVFEGSSGGATAKVSGDMEFKEIKVAPQLVDPRNVARLERHVKEAAGQALKKARDEVAKKMKGVTGGLGLPGMFE
ncbi:YbaB/EbfC family nucleoid-associated protein [Candidatus Margulisiibacteriota bacterium]